MVGLGSGFLFLPSIAVLPQYFEKRRPLATGIGSSGSAIGKASGLLLLTSVGDCYSRRHLLPYPIRYVRTAYWLSIRYLAHCPHDVGDFAGARMRYAYAISTRSSPPILRRQSMDRASVYALGLLSFRVIVRAVLTFVLHSTIRCQVHGSEPRIISTTSFVTL